MTPNQFRKVARALPGAIDGAHGGHPDFRAGAGGKVFASLGAPDAAHGTVKLTPDQQALLVETNAKVFVPVRGAWGEKGYTNVRLAAADAKSVKHALTLAHQNCAPTNKKANPASRELDRANARVRKAIKASKLPGIEESTSYGYPAMKAGGKFMMRVKDADTLVFSCPRDEKAMLMEAAPEIYFETDHYKGWPAVLARLSAMSDAELVHRVGQAWRTAAPKKLMAGLEARPSKATSKKPKR
jgi:hypothetical protein